MPNVTGITETAMRGLVVSDDASDAQKVRTVLSGAGLECQDQDMVSLDVAADRASRLSPSLIVVVLSPDPERGLAALRDVSRTIQTHIFVLGPTDTDLILRSMQSGAAEYIDAVHLENELAAAIVRFKARNTSQPDGNEPGRVITILGPSGGSGSSMVAANVAAALAKHHDSVGLLDLRLSTGDLASLFDVVPQHTVADLCRNIHRADNTMFDQAFVRHESGVRLLAAPRDYAQIQSVTARGIRQTIAMARRRFPYVVIDLDNVINEEQIEALWQSDVTLFVLRLDYTSVRNVRRALDHLQGLGMDLDRVRLVANRFGERKQLTAAQAKEALRRDISFFVPDDPASINRAINDGIPVVLQRPSAKVSKSLTNLAVSINGRHNP